jgi:hypothetical protein
VGVEQRLPGFRHGPAPRPLYLDRHAVHQTRERVVSGKFCSFAYRCARAPSISTRLAIMNSYLGLRSQTHATVMPPPGESHSEPRRRMAPPQGIGARIGSDVNGPDASGSRPALSAAWERAPGQYSSDCGNRTHRCLRLPRCHQSTDATG